MNFSLELPQAYRAREVLAFHGRDPENLAENVEANRLRKGFILEGMPSVLDISLKTGRAYCRVEADGDLSAPSRETFRQIARNMLALNILPEPFEIAVANDPLLGTLVQRQTGLRIPQTATPFEAVTWAVIGQQINLPFAISLRRSLIRLAGRRHSGGLWCYPDAAAVARLNGEDLGRHKFSRAKAETLIRLARLAESGDLPLDEGQNHHPAEEIGAALLAVKGIGPWTVNYTLLRGFGCEDCSLHGDAAIRTALHRLDGSVRLTTAAIQLLLERYQPHRSLAAAHLWASLSFSAA